MCFMLFKIFQKLFQDDHEDVPEYVSSFEMFQYYYLAIFTDIHSIHNSQVRLSGPATFAVAPGGARLRPDGRW